MSHLLPMSTIFYTKSAVDLGRTEAEPYNSNVSAKLPTGDLRSWTNGNRNNQALNTKLPSSRQPAFDSAPSVSSHDYATTMTFSTFNANSKNSRQKQQRPASKILIDDPRLMKIDDEEKERKHNITNLKEVGSQLLQSQVDMQAQILQYQLMLEQCMETLEYQNFIINGQTEELHVLQERFKRFEYLIDEFKQRKKENLLQQKAFKDANVNNFGLFNLQNALSFKPTANIPVFSENENVTRF